MKKYIMDLRVQGTERLSERHVLLRLGTTDGSMLPEMTAGQFVEVRIDETPSTMLRRPISINYVDRERNELWLLVAAIGDGTRWLAGRKEGDTVNCIVPLGRGFTIGTDSHATKERWLLVGGGVGVAPMMMLGDELRRRGADVTFLLGGRTEKDILERDMFESRGRVCITTEDGSSGERGMVTQHTVMGEQFDRVATCGPKPMMMAIARWARERGIPCEVSLENMMACGIGACLCCVEKTVRGNVCVCKEGPVFDANELNIG